MPVSQANWTKPGATLSHKKACKQFGIEESEGTGSVELLQ